MSRPYRADLPDRLLRLRRRMARREPDFVRIDQWRYRRIEDSGWRRPRGLDNKIRQQRKGWPPKVKPGYRKPAAVRGLHPTGFVEVLVHRPEDLAGLDPAKHAVRIAATVGLRKRLEIVKAAKERGLLVLNAGARVQERLKLNSQASAG